jgi:hypothetical protein
VTCKYCGRDEPLGHELKCDNNPGVKEIKNLIKRLEDIQKNTDSIYQKQELNNILAKFNSNGFSDLDIRVINAKAPGLINYAYSIIRTGRVLGISKSSNPAEVGKML